MNRLVLLLAAAVVVLLADAWVLISSRQNRAAADGGTVELTERELRLPPIVGDSTAILLDLVWRADSAEPEMHRSPDWLNTAKLTELGFDCRVAATSSHAREHYLANRSVVVYLVLVYEGEAWKRASRQGTRQPTWVGDTHLFAVDAGRDPRQLRQKYPDPAHQIITRGVVGLRFADRGPDDRPLPQPRIMGVIEELAVNRVFVPAPLGKVLQGLRHRFDQPQGEREPRFAATVSWGRRFEPWLENVKLLPRGVSE